MELEALGDTRLETDGRSVAEVAAAVMAAVMAAVPAWPRPS